ncbi:MAG: hypothetical protein SF053_06510 [Bacteroidia bacterium]|nr:hypothetical protein [Bacteroidia bacterium]
MTRSTVQWIIIGGLATALTVTATLGWQAHQTSLALAADLEREVVYRQKDVLSFIVTMLDEIRNEELNMNKLINLGLRDTIQYIQKHTDELLAGADTLPIETYDRWKAELEAMYRSQIKNHDWVVSDTVLAARPAYLPVQHKLQLLEWEQDLLSMFNSRLGGLCYWGKKIQLVLRADRDTISEGGYYEADIIYELSPEKATDFHIWSDDFSYTQEHASVIIPTFGLLRAGETSRKVGFEVSGLIEYPTGGFWRVATRDTFTVVRPPSTHQPE